MESGLRRGGCEARTTKSTRTPCSGGAPPSAAASLPSAGPATSLPPARSIASYGASSTRHPARAHACTHLVETTQAPESTAKRNLTLRFDTAPSSSVSTTQCVSAPAGRACGGLAGRR